jgi:hypothetical protein
MIHVGEVVAYNVHWLSGRLSDVVRREEPMGAYHEKIEFGASIFRFSCGSRQFQGECGCTRICSYTFGDADLAVDALDGIALK